MEPIESLPRLLVRLEEQGITGYRRARAVHQLLDDKARKRGVPLTGTFELTPLCNLDCKMCYVHLNREQMGSARLLTTEQWREIMTQAVEGGMLYANLTGGECLTYPGFWELYQYLQSRGIQVTILTNGLLLGEKAVDYLKKQPPARIQVTLYGAGDEGYERVTGHRCFQTVLHNIRLLQEAHLPVNVVTTPSEFMTDGVQVVELMHNLHMPMTINAGLVRPREDTGRDLCDAGLDTYIAMLRRRRELTGEESPSPPMPEDQADEQPLGVRCGAGRSSFSIDWQGTMKPCNNFPCPGENVLTFGFAQAWRLTHTTAAGFLQPAECRGCRYRGVCKHCVAEHAAGAPIGHASPNICAWGKRMVAEGFRRL